MDSRTLIGQACGLVMERYNVDAAWAYALLTRISATHNVKMRQIATELIHARRLPTPPAANDA